MGSTPSKAARRLLQERPSRAAPRVTPAAVHPQGPLPFESKVQATESDDKDPHFMEKLGQLGQVRVDHHHTHTVRPNTYRSRTPRSEADATSSRPSDESKLSASSLAELLDARKSIASGAELETLARQYDVDVAKLQRLTRVVNTPSVDESTVVRTTDKHGEEFLIMMARWVDPV